MTNPHDALFQYTFSQPEHAARLIRGNLPASIAERIEWATLERLPGSFIDQELTWRHTDLLFRARIAGREALIYLLLEHQSTVDPLMALRLLGYMNRIWEQVVKQDPNARLIPAIVPLVIFHGGKGWSVPSGVQALTAILCYLFKVTDPEPSSIIEVLETRVGTRAVEAFMTYAERLIQQGEAKGRADGEAKGRAEILRKQMTLKFGPLSSETEKRISSAAIADLDRWSERVLSAQRIEEIFR
jgi:predicted transposase YdaD